MKTFTSLLAAIVCVSALSSCQSNPRSMEELTMASANQHPLISDYTEVRDGKTYRVRRYLTNEHPRETVLKVELASR